MRWLWSVPFLYSMSLLGDIDTIVIPEGLLTNTGLDAHFIAEFALFVATVLFGTLLIGKLCKYLFKLPVIAGQIIGGIILGPSLLNIRQLSMFIHPAIFVDTATGNLYSFVSSDFFVLFILVVSASITVGYLLWSAGYETNLKSLLKVGLIAVNAGILGAVMPIAMIGGLAYFLLNSDISQMLGLGIVFAATSVSIPIAMLFASHKMHLRSSQATLGAAIIDDVVAVVLLSIFLIFLQAGTFGALPTGYHAPESSLGLALGRMIMAFIVLFIAGLYVIPHVVKGLHKRHFSHLIGPIAFIVMLLFFSGAELIGGLAGITGAYFAGFFHRQVDTKNHAEKIMSPFVNSLLLPLFLGSIGFQVDLKILTLSSWVIVGWLLIAAVFSKVLSTYCAIWFNNWICLPKARWSWLEGYIFGASMVPRGEVGLVVASILRNSGVIDFQMYVISIVAIVLTTIVSPIMLSIGFARFDRIAVSNKEEKMVTVTLGMLPIIGANQLFEMIINVLIADSQFSSAIRFSEERQILDLKKYNVKIAYSPDEGVILEGDKDQIAKIVNLVKKEIIKDVGAIQA
ncbi:hypothetical protein A3F06_00070 [candidate division TM6 bacterium RIFCSPHIGHO2_12_FULL_36_22]|nr:MAG: hypothetical protein A3F06_00070 [candidate division TM6 bacterium RIFCSPHIGHO2_12_FULL_36_22]